MQLKRTTHQFSFVLSIFPLVWSSVQHCARFLRQEHSLKFPVLKSEAHWLHCRCFRYIEIFRSSSSECRRATILNSNGRGNDNVGFNNDRGFNGRGQRNNRSNFRGELKLHFNVLEDLILFLIQDRPYPDLPWGSNNSNNSNNDAPWRNNNRGNGNNNYGGGGNNNNSNGNSSFNSGGFGGGNSNPFNNSSSNSFSAGETQWLKPK